MEFYVELSDETLQNTNDITDLRYVPELNLEGGTYGFYVNLQRALEKLNPSQRINFIGDQISRYKSAIHRRNPHGLPPVYTIDLLLTHRLNELHEILDTMLDEEHQLYFDF